MTWTGIKSQTSSKSGQIGLFTSELIAISNEPNAKCLLALESEPQIQI